MEQLSSLRVIPLIFRRIIWRHWSVAWRSTGLLISILALGIAVFFSIRLANRAAVKSFEYFTGLLHQSSDWQISALAGSLSDSTLPQLRSAFGDLPVDIIPVLETSASAPRQMGEDPIGSRPMFDLVGLDLISIQNPASAAGDNSDLFNRPEAGTNSQGMVRLGDVLQKTNAVFISSAMARREHLQRADHLAVVIDDRVIDLEIAGIIPDLPSRPAAPDNLIIIDLPALQRLTHRPGKLDRIELSVPDGPLAESQRTTLHNKLVTLGKNRWQLLSQADRRAGAAMMTRAFRMNLNLLSTIGLLVGLYLIFQSLDGAVVRRREEISILRSLGITEKIIRQSWLLESAVLGLAGGIIGALFGWAGAQIAVRFVGRTVNALYYSTSVQSARLDGGEFMLALGIALGASLLAGWWPARQAAKTPSAQILSRALENQDQKLRWQSSLGQSAGFAAAVLAVSFCLVWLPPLRLAGALRIPLAGYAAAVGLIFGGGILCGKTLQELAHWFRSVGNTSAAARMALSHLAHLGSRHRLAAASVLCAVSMAAGMIILVASFDATMTSWIGNTFQADLYVTSSAAEGASSQNGILPETWRAIAHYPGIAELNAMQTAEIQINGISTMLVGVDVDFSRRHPNLTWRQRPSDADFFDDSRNENLGLASESFCERFRVQRGDLVNIPTPAGEKPLTISGVFSDYGNERGSLLISRRHFSAWFGDESARSLIIIAAPGVDPDRLQAELAHDFPALDILTNRHLRSEILRVFHQTFSLTYALELIGIVVAVVGLGMTFSSILIDRRTEMTTLRALGWRRDEMALSTAIEGTLLSVCAVVAGSIVSLGLGWILIYVINKQSFGWTLQFRVPWVLMSVEGLLVIVMGTVVAYLVGRWGSGLPADREE
jgi:putative ABC transport system permease protein